MFYQQATRVHQDVRLDPDSQDEVAAVHVNQDVDEGIEEHMGKPLCPSQMIPALWQQPPQAKMPLPGLVILLLLVLLLRRRGRFLKPLTGE